MSQKRRTNLSESLIPHTCRRETELETGAVRAAKRDPAVETYIAHRRCELHEALEDPFTPVTGPVRDPKSTGINTGPSWSRSWDNFETQLVDGPYRRYLSLDGMWRAVGSPAGKGPMDWIAMARPLVPAFKRYFENLAACGFHEKSNQRGYLFIAEEHLDDDRQAGDVITSVWLIAEAYASFLDSVVSSDG
jgi:hypothetical protein